MAYDETLAARIRAALVRKKNVEEKRMFGGICFLLNSNILVGVWKGSLIARLGPEQGEDAMLEPHVKAFDITGKPMKNWSYVPDYRQGQANCLDLVHRSLVSPSRLLFHRQTNWPRRLRSSSA